MEKYFDKIFQKLYSIDESDLWYKARHFVLDKLPPLDGKDGIGPDSSKHVHVVVEGTDATMNAIVRQICLIAHYANFDERDGKNRTVITFCIGKTPAKGIPQLTELGNLQQFCKCTLKDGEGNARQTQEGSRNLPLDIEFEFIEMTLTEYKNKIKDENVFTTIISQEDIASIGNVPQSIDISQGMLVNMAYHTGKPIDNLPPDDNDNFERYNTALNVFCYQLKFEHIVETWKSVVENKELHELNLKKQLSSIFCADCFRSHLRGILKTKGKSIVEYLLKDFDNVFKSIKKKETINALVRCEHSRWNVEKLILGYSPLTAEDHYKIETCFGEEKKKYTRDCKEKDLRHIDLCSNRDLRRLDPNSMKYDYFLMLAMPQILLSAYKH